VDLRSATHGAARTTSRAWLLAVCLIGAPLLPGAGETDPAGQTIGGDFSLTDHRGRPFALHDLRGKVVLLSFGYTYCPDICPLNLSLSAQVIASLGERGRDVIPVFVSLDPQRDSPEVLARYVRYFHPAMIGLTGSREQLARVADLYKARFAIQGDPKGDRYTLDHSASLYVLDGAGALAAIVPYGLPAEHIAARIEPLLPDPP
jgi:cytochrome oxidase Cu insertion factor (SCO1/SenC/PrrC family)